jgi:hypothetical protein
LDRHPIYLEVTDDLRRSRLTVFFRLLLALPHLLWLSLWSIPAWLAVIPQWFITLFAGRPSERLFRFIAVYLRYATHVNAYTLLLANPFPGFRGRPKGMRDIGTYWLRYQQQLLAYVLLLTDRYPAIAPEPTRAEPAPALTA